MKTILTTTFLLFSLVGFGQRKTTQKLDDLHVRVIGFTIFHIGNKVVMKTHYNKSHTKLYVYITGHKTIILTK